MTKFARLDRLPPYVFATVNGIKMEARRIGQDIIDLGMGNPDLGTPEHIVDKLVEEIRQTYQERRDTLISGLNRIGWDIPSPKGTMFVWGKIPQQYRKMGSVEFSKFLINPNDQNSKNQVLVNEYCDLEIICNLVLVIWDLNYFGACYLLF